MAHSKAADARSRKPAPRTPRPLWPRKASRIRLRIATGCRAAQAPSVSMLDQGGILGSATGENHFAERRLCLGPIRDDTNRRTASAIDRAVSAVAVATTSSLRARPQRAQELAARTPARILRAPQSSEASRERTFAAAMVRRHRLQSPSRMPQSFRRDRMAAQTALAVTASITMFPGPVSKANIRRWHRHRPELP